MIDAALEDLADDWEWWESCRARGGDPFQWQARANEFPLHARRQYSLYLADGAS